MPQDAPNLRPAPDPTPGSRTEAPDFPEPTSSKYLSARSNGPRWDPVNDFLVTHLDSIDERLLEYLDDDDELRLDVVQRLGFYTSALLASSITPDHVMEDWPDWFQLVPASWPPTAPRSCRSWRERQSSLKRSRKTTTSL